MSESTNRDSDGLEPIEPEPVTPDPTEPEPTEPDPVEEEPAAADVSEEYLAAGRLSIRTKSKTFDPEIVDLIRAAREDLALGGVLPERARDESDPLIKRAVMTYIKAEFGLDNEDVDKYRAAYDRLKVSLALASDYVGGGEV